MTKDGSTRALAVIAAAIVVAVASLACAATASAYSIWAIGGHGIACSTSPACGDGGPATAAQLAYPEGVAVASDGSVYIADWGEDEVREISPSGKITVVAGGGTACSDPPSCGDGGPATSAQLAFPDGVAVDSSGNVYIADTADNEIRKVSPKGIITRFAGNGTACSTPPSCGDGGAATSAELNSPQGVAVDRAGNVYVADAGDSEIRKVSPKGIISRIAGNGTPCSTAPSCGDGGAATASQLSFPAGVAVDSAGNVYIADDGDNEIRKVSPSGTISRIAGNGTICSTAPACGDGGPATSAKLGGPDGVAVDSHGNVYIADDLDNEVRKVSASGTIMRIAGSGAACAAPPSCGDGGPAASAQLDYPDGLALDAAGNVYVADTYDQELRFLSPGAATSIPSAKVALLAFGVVIGPPSITVRYALSGSAAVKLTVSAAGQPATVVASGSGRMGLGELVWKRRTAVPRHRYKLTVTATVAGRSASSAISRTL